VSEILGEERTERLVFPGLNVARGPIVQKREPGDMGIRLADRDRLAERVPRSYPDAKLELVIRCRHGPKLGADSAAGLRCPLGRCTGVPDGTTDDARPWFGDRQRRCADMGDHPRPEGVEASQARLVSIPGGV
jgi:hypothetical protein